MNPAPVTSLYTALLALWVMVLLLRVVLMRWRYRVGEGYGEHRDLAKAIRVHANAVETLPIALLLMFGYELGGGGATLLHFCGSALIAGRLAHAYGLGRSFGYSIGRFGGTATVAAVVLTLAPLIIYRNL